MSYMDVYKLRLNRYGLNYQQRIQTEREHLFELYLLKTVYHVTFEYNGEMHEGSFEKYKQDETKTLHYLLTKLDVKIPNGTILEMPDNNKTDSLEKWMVYYLEEIQASGYNRYVMLRMTHLLHWLGRDDQWHEAWAYMYGQEDNMLKDEIRSRSRMDTLYAENLKMSFFVLPRNEFVRRDNYFIVGEKPFQEYYRVTGYDIQSTENVEYVTVDPVYEFDLSVPPEKEDEDDGADFFWFNGGDSDGT